MTTYTDTMCPITLSYAHELTHPVAFSTQPSQPYELVPLWKWVLASNRHPLTGRACSLNDIVVLKEGDVDGSRTRITEAMLEGMRVTVQDTLVIVFHTTLVFLPSRHPLTSVCPQEFKKRIHELDQGLSTINESIRNVSRELDTIKIEKLRLELQIKNVRADYCGGRESIKNRCTVC